MAGGSPSPPPAPDPVATAKAQGAINKETAIAQARLNQVNEYTPYGSAVYAPTGGKVDGIQQFQRTISLSQAQQAKLDQQNAISSSLGGLAQDQIGRINTSLAQPFSYSGMPAAPQANNADRQQVSDALYNQYASRLDPRFSAGKTALETQLANQGISVGSNAYSSAMGDFGRTKNDAYQSAMNQSVAGGGAEQSRLFGLESTARARAIQEAAYLRNKPLTDTAALMGQAGGVTIPQFASIPQTGVSGTDITGPTALQYQGQMNAYNQRMGQRNSTMGGLFGLGGAALGAAGSAGLFGSLGAAAPLVMLA